MPKTTAQRTRFCEDFGKRLQGILDQKGLSQTWLADRLGVSTGSVGNWCQGINLPSLENTVQIAAAVGESVAFLVGDKLTGRDSLTTLSYRLGQRLGLKALTAVTHVPDDRLRAALASALGETALEMGGLPSEPAVNGKPTKKPRR